MADIAALPPLPHGTKRPATPPPDGDGDGDTKRRATTGPEAAETPVPVQRQPSVVAFSPAPAPAPARLPMPRVVSGRVVGVPEGQFAANPMMTTPDTRDHPVCKAYAVTMLMTNATVVKTQFGAKLTFGGQVVSVDMAEKTQITGATPDARDAAKGVRGALLAITAFHAGPATNVDDPTVSGIKPYLGDGNTVALPLPKVGEVIEKIAVWLRDPNVPGVDSPFGRVVRVFGLTANAFVAENTRELVVGYHAQKIQQIRPLHPGDTRAAAIAMAGTALTYVPSSPDALFGGDYFELAAAVLDDESGAGTVFAAGPPSFVGQRGENKDTIGAKLCIPIGVPLPPGHASKAGTALLRLVVPNSAIEENRAIAHAFGSSLGPPPSADQTLSPEQTVAQATACMQIVAILRVAHHDMFGALVRHWGKPNGAFARAIATARASDFFASFGFDPNAETHASRTNAVVSDEKMAKPTFGTAAWVNRIAPLPPAAVAALVTGKFDTLPLDVSTMLKIGGKFGRFAAGPGAGGAARASVIPPPLAGPDTDGGARVYIAANTTQASLLLETFPTARVGVLFGPTSKDALEVMLDAPPPAVAPNLHKVPDLVRPDHGDMAQSAVQQLLSDVATKRVEGVPLEVAEAAAKEIRENWTHCMARDPGHPVVFVFIAE